MHSQTSVKITSSQLAASLIKLGLYDHQAFSGLNLKNGSYFPVFCLKNSHCISFSLFFISKGVELEVRGRANFC